MTDPVDTAQDLRVILNQIDIKPSMVRPRGFGFAIRDIDGGWLIRLEFIRPDRDTGRDAMGAGRWEFICRGATESGVVKTAWLLLDLLARHEAMESFTYRGVRIFDPHHTVDQLTAAATWCEARGKGDGK